MNIDFQDFLESCVHAEQRTLTCSLVAEDGSVYMTLKAEDGSIAVYEVEGNEVKEHVET
jgi:hypothetical protein